MNPMLTVLFLDANAAGLRRRNRPVSVAAPLERTARPG